MHAKFWVLLLCLSSTALFGQADQSATSPAKPPADSGSSSSSGTKQKEIKEDNYIRKFSIGATFSPVILSLMKKGSSSTTTTTTSATTTDVTTNLTTTGKSQRAGYGVTGQIMLNDHFAVSISAIMRKMGYTFDHAIETTTTKGTTITDSTVSYHEDTRARLLDFPITARYYTKNRQDPGPRVFFDLGGALRQVSHVATNINYTDASGNITCCSVAPASPTNRLVRGAVAGFGVFLIDPVGVRVIPEVRYTRWLNDTFNSTTTRMQRNGVEVNITFSF